MINRHDLWKTGQGRATSHTATMKGDAKQVFGLVFFANQEKRKMAAHPSDAQAKADNHADAGARPPLRYNEEKVEAIMKEFVNSTSTEYAFAPPMSPQERAIVHSMAEKYSLNHTSEGTPDKRVVVLGKTNLVAISNSASVEGMQKH
jgi:hypothetical protein